jgi:hypothetical protein
MIDFTKEAFFKLEEAAAFVEKVASILIDGEQPHEKGDVVYSGGRLSLPKASFESFDFHHGMDFPRG